MVLTTGVPNGPVVARQELRTFLKDKDVTTLFILAMDQMMKIPQGDLASWFQVAAIHGRPYIPYDNVGAKGTFKGYCTHSSVLFPPWHRPYLALYEQMLSKHVHEIANEYKDAERKARYCKAAERFRIPYWDWAIEAALPDIVAHQPTVTVELPDGTQRPIKNPLFGYNFNPAYEDFGDNLPDEKTWAAWQTTVRYPTTKDHQAVSTPNVMQGTLKNNQNTLRDRVYNLLTKTKDYDTFSHDAAGGTEVPPGSLDNIESIHNQIHGLAGGDGHMGVVDYASFDPVFWLHHANVDRLFALWQALHPNAYVDPPKSGSGAVSGKPVEVTQQGQTHDASTPLTPFRRTNDTFWDSTGVRDTRVFKYTYPELEKWDTLSKEEKKKRIRVEINRLYGKAAPVSLAKPSVFKPLLAAPHGAGPTAAIAHAHAHPHHGAHGEDKPHYHEWFADIVVEKYAVNSTFFIHIFLGDVTSDSDKWGMDPNLVGSHCVFANNATFTGCGKCHSDREKRQLVTGSIPLTNTLVDRFGHISSLEPEEIAPYLEKNLHWRVQRHNRSPVDAKDCPGLKVSVHHCVVEVPESVDDFATWGDAATHTSVTVGRAGGHH